MGCVCSAWLDVLFVRKQCAFRIVSGGALEGELQCCSTSLLLRRRWRS